MDFARKQLEKYGWTDGKGLGKHENGMAEPLEPKIKRSVAGIGHDPASEFNEHWWTALYDKAASNVEMSNYVFVYGTLKRNEPNHHWLTNEENGVSHFVGDGTTATKYPLIIATIYNIPFLLQSPGKGNYVKGDVYEVDDLMLSQLDILEGHPKYYVREKDDIKVLNASTGNKEVMKCWVYFLKQFKPELLKYRMFESYSSTGDHGKPYMERSLRDENHDPFKDVKDLKTEG